ncbi:MAG: hypothetical protein ABIL01_11940 [Pseudomonadota bacterium]
MTPEDNKYSMPHDFDGEQVEQSSDLEKSKAAAERLSEYQFEFPAVIDADVINNVSIQNQQAIFTIDRDLLLNACRAVVLPFWDDKPVTAERGSSGKGVRQGNSGDRSDSFSRWSVLILPDRVRIFSFANGLSLSTIIPLADAAKGVPSKGLSFQARAWSLLQLVANLPSGAIQFVYQASDRHLTVAMGRSFISLVTHAENQADLTVSQTAEVGGTRFDASAFSRSLRLVRMFSPPKAEKVYRTIQFDLGDVRCGTRESVIRHTPAISFNTELLIDASIAGILEKVLHRFRSDECQLRISGHHATIFDPVLTCHFQMVEHKFPDLASTFATATGPEFGVPAEQLRHCVSAMAGVSTPSSMIGLYVDSQSADNRKLVFTRRDPGIKGETSASIFVTDGSPSEVSSPPSFVLFQHLVKVARLSGDESLRLRFAPGRGVYFSVQSEQGISEVFIHAHILPQIVEPHEDI